MELVVAGIRVDESRVRIGRPDVGRIGCPIAAFNFSTTNENIVFRAAQPLLARLRIHEPYKFWVAGSVGWFGNVYVFEEQLLPEAILAAFNTLFPMFIIPRIRSQSLLTIDKNVVFGNDAVAAVRKYGGKVIASAGISTADEHVSENGIASVAVVEIDRRGAVAHAASDIVPIVVAYHVAPARRIAAFIKRASIVRRFANIVYFVQLEDVIVAQNINCLMGCIVDVIVCGPITYAFKPDAMKPPCEPDARTARCGCPMLCGLAGVSVLRSPPLSTRPCMPIS